MGITSCAAAQDYRNKGNIVLKAEGVRPVSLLDFPTQLNYVVGEGIKRTTFRLTSAVDPISRAELRVVQVPHAAPARPPRPSLALPILATLTFQAFASHFSGLYTLKAGVVGVCVTWLPFPLL